MADLATPLDFPSTMVPLSPSASTCQPVIEEGLAEGPAGIALGHLSEVSPVDDDGEGTESPSSESTLSDASSGPITTNLRPALHLRPGNPRRSSYLARTSSNCEDLAILSEEDETQAHDVDSDINPSSPSQRVWLCCPPSSPLASSATTAPWSPSSGRLPRPFITRSMSTGRLATEFDEQGRVVCLSVHSDRVLLPKLSTSPRRDLTRAQSALPKLGANALDSPLSTSADGSSGREVLSRQGSVGWVEKGSRERLVATPVDMGEPILGTQEEGQGGVKKGSASPGTRWKRGWSWGTGAMRV